VTEKGEKERGTGWHCHCSDWSFETLFSSATPMQRRQVLGTFRLFVQVTHLPCFVVVVVVDDVVVVVDVDVVVAADTMSTGHYCFFFIISNSRLHEFIRRPVICCLHTYTFLTE